MLLKQPVMNRVLYALIPIIFFSIYLFGWKVLAIVLVSNVFAFLTEFLFVKNKKSGKVSMAVFVTGSLLALTLPPTIPIWMCAIGSIFGVMFGKMVYGGFGLNIFNPAIVGRAFLYISFPQQMTVNWMKPYQLSDFPGGLVRWLGEPILHTSATILGQIKQTNMTEYSFTKAFFGFVPGSVGETSSLIIILAGVYLVVTKTAKLQPIIATIFSLLIFNLLFYPDINPFFQLVSGGVLFGSVFMVTDPVSQPKGKIAVWIYGLLIGFLSVFIKKYSLFAGGMMFAILLANSFMPILEIGLDKWFSTRIKAVK